MRQDVHLELDRIHLSRNRLGYLVHVFLISLSTFFQSELLKSHFWILVLCSMSVGLATRVLIFEYFERLWEEKNPWIRGLNYLSLIIIALSWGAHYGDVCFHYGLNSVNASNTLMILAGIIAGAGTSLGTHRGSYLVFVTSMFITPTAYYLLDPTVAHRYMALYFFIFYVFNIVAFNQGFRFTQRSVEKKLVAKEERDRFRRLINAVPGYVSFLDKDLVYVDANDANLKFSPDMIGNRLGHLGRESDYVRFVEKFVESDKEVDVSEIHVEFFGKDMWFLVSVQKIIDGGIVVVAIPMDELVRARQELRVQEAKAQYSAKLASLGEMAAGIAHEVNNPLAIIHGSASIIQDIVEADEIDRDSIRLLTSKLISTSERISKTIKSLKALSRSGESDPFEAVSVKQVILQCLDICQHRLRNHEIRMILEHQEDDLFFNGREVQICQVLVNLLNNAIDAVKLNLAENWIKIDYKVTSNWLEIFVIDSGRGIPKEIESKIMEPFFTTKEINQGTGLGLSISKNIIREHAGELSYLPDLPHTTFRIRLPKSS